MLRAFSLFALLSLCWFPAGVSPACDFDVPRRAGESEAHALERLRQVNQNRYWNDANTVFVGEVVGLHWRNRYIEVSVLPRASFKGNAGPGLITYALDEHHGSELNCGRAAFPDFEKVGLFYANRENDALTVRAMLGPNDIRDEALRVRTIRQLSEFEVMDLEMERPPQHRGPLLLAGLFAFCTFIAGLALGRVWRSRSHGPSS